VSREREEGAEETHLLAGVRDRTSEKTGPPVQSGVALDRRVGPRRPRAPRPTLQLSADVEVAEVEELGKCFPGVGASEAGNELRSNAGGVGADVGGNLAMDEVEGEVEEWRSELTADEVASSLREKRQR
jgi:hypothetical protein